MKLEIKGLQKRLNLSAIYVTHDQEEALTISDRIAVYNNGKLLQAGTPEELYENPANRFVADFIGTSNFIPVRFKREEGGLMVWVDSEQDGFFYHTYKRGSPDPDQSMDLAIRPEKLFFTDDGWNGQNKIEGEVTEVIYTGDSTRYRLAISETRSIEVNCQNRYGVKKYGSGDRVTVGWHVEDGKILTA
jgi:ABC-type Fe3+/spermidine/putrescine transport system ATPase subunit